MRTRSKRARAAKQAHAQLDTVKGRLKPAVESAASSARDRGVLVAERVGPAVEAARERVGPAVDSAREKVGPVVADARDRVVDDLLPRLVEVIAAASAAAIAARDNAVDQAQETATEAVKNFPVNKRKRRRRRFVFLTVTAAAVGAGIAAAKARSQQEDPWTPGPSTPSGTSAASVNGTPRLTTAPTAAPTTPTPVVNEPAAVVDEPAPVLDEPTGIDESAPTDDSLSDELAEESSQPADER